MNTVLYTHFFLNLKTSLQRFTNFPFPGGETEPTEVQEPACGRTGSEWVS